MAGVMDAVAGEKIENAPAVGSKQLGPAASRVLLIHLQHVQQLYPLRVDVGIVEMLGRLAPLTLPGSRGR